MENCLFPCSIVWLPKIGIRIYPMYVSSRHGCSTQLYTCNAHHKPMILEEICCTTWRYCQKRRGWLRSELDVFFDPLLLWWKIVQQEGFQSNIHHMGSPPIFRRARLQIHSPGSPIRHDVWFSSSSRILRCRLLPYFLKKKGFLEFQEKGTSAIWDLKSRERLSSTTWRRDFCNCFFNFRVHCNAICQLVALKKQPAILPPSRDTLQALLGPPAPGHPESGRSRTVRHGVGRKKCQWT